MCIGNCEPCLIYGTDQREAETREGGKVVLGLTYGYDRYYDGGVSSVYFWDLDDGFAGVILLKKSKFSR